MVIFTVILPPVDVRATQSSSSAPVEVSWSPSAEGDADITGYRIFYGSGENVLVSSRMLGWWLIGITVVKLCSFALSRVSCTVRSSMSLYMWVS